MKSDITIIGGGVIGICTAYYLLKRGRSVTLLERGEVCSGSSYGNAGLIVPGHSMPLSAPGVVSKALKWMGDPESPFYIKPRADAELASWLWQFRRSATKKRMHAAIPVLYRLSMESVRRYEELIASEGLLCNYAAKGLLGVYRSRKNFEDGKEEAAILAGHGLDIDILEPSDVYEKSGNVLKEGIVGAVHFKEDAHLTPVRFVQTLAERVTAMGGDIRTQTEVIGIETSDDRITGIQTTRGDFEPDQVVLSAGSWSPSVGEDLGLRLPIQPAKGYSITYMRPDGWPDIPINLNDTKIAVTPMGPHIRLAGTLELAGMDLSVNRRRVNAILRGAREALNGVDDMEHVETWRGLRPCTPDGMPILGRSPKQRNLTLATGHAMVGVSLGPVTGDLAAAITCDESPDIDLTLLRPERFQ